MVRSRDLGLVDCSRAVDVHLKCVRIEMARMADDELVVSYGHGQVEELFCRVVANRKSRAQIGACRQIRVCQPTVPTPRTTSSLSIGKRRIATGQSSS